MSIKELALYGAVVVVLATLVSFGIQGTRQQEPIVQNAEVSDIDQILSDEQIDALVELLVAYEEDPGVVREVERQLRRH